MSDPLYVFSSNFIVKLELSEIFCFRVYSGMTSVSWTFILILET